MATFKIRPLDDRVIIEPQEKETMTQGGIVLPDSAGKDKPMRGIVIAIGPGKYIDGKIQPLQVKVGDEVLFGKYSGTHIKFDDKDYLFLKEEDILGVFE